MKTDKETKFRAIAEGRINPQPVSYQEISVELGGEGALIDNFATVDYAAITAVVESTGGKVPFSESEYVQYNRTFLVSRVGWVNNTGYVIHPNDKVYCPAFLSVVLSNVGLAEDVSLGIALRPKCVVLNQEVEGDLSREERLLATYDVLSKEDVLRISAFLAQVPGFNGALGFIKDKSGVFDFMSMQLVDNEIRRHDSKAHPVYALLSSIVAPHMVASALSPIVRYGDVTFLSRMLWEVSSV